MDEGFSRLPRRIRNAARQTSRYDARPAAPYRERGAGKHKIAAAFQTLYRKGIFKGAGDLRMDPKGATTRAQFVALVHRINLMLEN